MDYRFTPDQERFQHEVRAFLKDALPPGFMTIDEESDEATAFAQAFAKKLAARGWLAPAWPKEYGGGGLSQWEQLILKFELAYASAPEYNQIATGFVGPTVILYGTPEQKKQHLSAIANADTFWCQGYSEPNAGSDLSSLTTRAVRDGDSFVINGQKIWTSLAHLAKWMILLCRTDPDAPKHRGISYFLVPMDTPGITVRPLVNLANGRNFSETFLEDVRIPAECLLGELNRGWYMAAATLDFERANVATWVAISQRIMEGLVARLQTPEGKAVVEANPTLRDEVAQICIDIEAARYLSYRVVSMQAAGLVPNYEASISKVFNSEMVQRMTRVCMKGISLYGQLMPGSKYEYLQGYYALNYQLRLGLTIAAGTSEIQRNIIAQRGLGLPRG